VCVGGVNERKKTSRVKAQEIFLGGDFVGFCCCCAGGRGTCLMVNGGRGREQGFW